MPIYLLTNASPVTPKNHIRTLYLEMKIRSAVSATSDFYIKCQSKSEDYLAIEYLDM